MMFRTRRHKPLFLATASMVALATGCSALLGDFEVSGTAVAADGGNDVALSDAPVADSPTTQDGSVDSGMDGGDAGCKVPPGATTLSDAVKVASGSDHTCAIRQDGALYCWGNNNFGQLGVPQATALSSPKPVKVQFPPALGAATIVQVALTESATFAIDSQLRLWAWGSNQQGLLATGATDATPHEVPAIVKTGTTSGAPPLLVRQIAPHWYAACALSATGDVVCWGKNFAGELGVAPPAPPEGTDSFVPVKAFSSVGAPSPNAILAPGIGSPATCYTSGDSNDPLRCWGLRSGGLLLANLASPPTSGANYSAVMPLTTAGAAGPLQQVSYGTNYGAALDHMGRLFTWGTTDNAQHGPGGAPAAGTVKNAPGAWRNMSTGYVFLCAVDDMKHVRCRGSNTQMQLGRTTSSTGETEMMMPVDVGGGKTLENVRSVHAGFFHACAVIEGACGANGPGAVKCWGQGTKGELGNGATASSVLPVDVAAP